MDVINEKFINKLIKEYEGADLSKHVVAELGRIRKIR